MLTPVKMYYDKRAEILVKNLKSRHFDAYYCETKEDALAKALELIPEGATVSWGGSETNKQVGLIDAVKNGNYDAVDRFAGTTPRFIRENKKPRRTGGAVGKSARAKHKIPLSV